MTVIYKLYMLIWVLIEASGSQECSPAFETRSENYFQRKTEENLVTSYCQTHPNGLPWVWTLFSLISQLYYHLELKVRTFSSSPVNSLQENVLQMKDHSDN